MTKFFIMLLVSIICLISQIALAEQCSNTHINQEINQLGQWVTKALNGQSSLGCSSPDLNNTFSRLEIAAKKNSICGKNALASLIAFSAVLSGDPNYVMCGFKERVEKLVMQISKDGTICANSGNDNKRTCFGVAAIIIFKLKTSGNFKQAFELAKKTADSSDVTGLSQLALAFFYQFGNGTNLNLTKAIYWHQEALKRLADKNLHIGSLMAIGVAYEDLNDSKSALKYFRLCANMGDQVCEQRRLRWRKIRNIKS